MSSSESNVSGINLELFKRLRFYQILDPNGRKLFDCNAYRLAWTAANVVTGCAVALSLVGLLVGWQDYAGVGVLALVQPLFFYLVYSLYLLKCVTLVRRADDLWRLIDVTRERFVVSDRCREHVAMFHEQRARSIAATDALCKFGFVVASQWLAFPLLVNASLPGVTARLETVFNLPFPVSARLYSDYHALFYAAELCITVCMTYVQVLFDAFIMSLCYVFIVHYDIVARSLENSGGPQRYRDRRPTDQGDKSYRMVKYYDDFISIIVDLQNIYLKLKSFYSIVRLITLSYVVLYSGLIISLTYSFVMVFSSSESVPILKIIKLSSAFVYLLFVLFYFSYLMGKINIKKESIKFSIYSCNWTAMDLKTKSLLTLAMRIEEANKMMIKITPNKVVNLQLFTSVMLTCYNIISFMLNASSN